ncbi:hypothetical protein [Streptomyces ortus]|uniref:Minor tail protein n=1 Tax=Streptomyces ortus TaxID=2867268 RepID=A0ABT3UWP9_9ACTN|nr:hypothetical protein [Streptomyces ortus]MCX4231984.1 hypothetical protein [Streptomyces ortus]
MTDAFEQASMRRLAASHKRKTVRDGTSAPAVRGGDWRLATVTAVGTGTVTADGILARCMETYANPAVGDLIRIDQSSSGNWVAMGRLAAANGVAWTTPTLGTGYTQGNTTSTGNNNGAVRYRRINVQGTWFMEWDGGADRANGAQTANLLSAVLAVGLRPVRKASFVIARNATSITGVAASTSVVHSLKLDFNQDGTVTLISATAGDAETNWLSLKGIRYPLD